MIVGRMEFDKRYLLKREVTPILVDINEVVFFELITVGNNGEYSLTVYGIEQIEKAMETQRLATLLSGEYDSKTDFAQEMIPFDEIESKIGYQYAMYFDYEAFAHDLFITDYVYNNGYVFRIQ